MHEIASQGHLGNHDINKRWELLNLVIILGIILLIIGFIAAVHIIWILGIIAVVVGAVLAIAGFTGREIGGRKHYF